MKQRNIMKSYYKKRVIQIVSLTRVPNDKQTTHHKKETYHFEDPFLLNLTIANIKCFLPYQEFKNQYDKSKNIKFLWRLSQLRPTHSFISIMLKVCKKVKKISFYVKSWRPGQLEVVKLTKNMGDGSCNCTLH